MRMVKWAFVTVLVLVAVGALIWLGKSYRRSVSTTRVVINEAARTLLYIPLYHALEKGYFKDEGLNVEIVTGGTATNSFAAMLSGEAQFSQADPMYVPISRQSGAKTKVVAQVVGRIAIWGVTMDPKIQTMEDPKVLRGKRISTHQRPMTAYVYTVQLIKDVGLEPDKDVAIIQGMPGTELVPLLQKQADFAMTIEPQVSKAVQQGGRVVFSYPEKLGDRIFTGLMTTEDFIARQKPVVRGVVKAYQRALNDIHANPSSAVASAKRSFPQLEEKIIDMALRRMISDQVIPKSVAIPEESWQKAIRARVAIGDLKEPVPSFRDSVDEEFARETVVLPSK